MKQYIYLMHPDKPAPAGTGNTRDWFNTYKWTTDCGNELYVPVPYQLAIDGRWPRAGDRLWFMFEENRGLLAKLYDGFRRYEVVGHVEITGLSQPTFGDFAEVWYDITSAKELSRSARRLPRVKDVIFEQASIEQAVALHDLHEWTVTPSFLLEDT